MTIPKHEEDVTFSFSVSLDDLLEMDIEALNDHAQEQFDIQFGTSRLYLSDISYRPDGVDHMGDIAIETTAIVLDFDQEQEEKNG